VDVDRALLAAADAPDSRVRDVAQYLIARGGKRIRPALLFVVAELGHAERRATTAAAVLVELIHVASLYHDDVIDRAPLRRSARSVNGRWGNAIATTSGTFLMARALEIAASLGEDVNRLTASAVSRLCTGQLQEIESAFDAALTEETHLEIIDRKTATLFQLACRLAAHLAGLSDAHRGGVDRYATEVGLAFQLADDALDLVGEARRLGKRPAADMREGVYSLAILRCLASGAEACAGLRELLSRERLTDADLRDALRIVRGSGEVERALQTARRHATLAIEAAAALPAGPVASSLANLARLAVDRSS